MTVRLPQRRRAEVVAWLHHNVDSNRGRADNTDPLAAWHVAVVARIATWKSTNGLWTVTQSQRSGNAVTVEADPDVEILLSLMFGSA